MRTFFVSFFTFSFFVSYSIFSFFSLLRKKIWRESGAIDELWYLPTSLRVSVLPGLPGLRVSLLASLFVLLCCSESVDSELSICEFTPATACVLLRVCFSIFEVISRLGAMHTVLNRGFVHTLPKEQVSPAQQILFWRGHDPYTLACKARPSLTDVGLF